MADSYMDDGSKFIYLDDDKFSGELIMEALKEAILNNAKSLKYIDRILSNWKNEGIKTKEDIVKKSEKRNKKSKKEVFEYDWLNEQD